MYSVSQSFFNYGLSAIKLLLLFLVARENPLLPEPCLFTARIEDLSRKVCGWKILFGEALSPLKLLIAVVLIALLPGSISEGLKVVKVKPSSFSSIAWKWSRVSLISRRRQSRVSNQGSVFCLYTAAYFELDKTKSKFRKPKTENPLRLHGLWVWKHYSTYKLLWKSMNLNRKICI